MKFGVSHLLFKTNVFEFDNIL